MASSIIDTLSLTLFFTLLFFPNPTFSAQVPESSPSPSPQLPSSPAFLPNSPPAPPPEHKKSPTPAPSPAEHNKSPSPAPDAPADAGQENQTHLGDLPDEDGSGGMSGGKKFGIAVGVIIAGCAVGLAAVVYRKRQRNIRRANYSYTDRRDFL